jgi:hypothetical protein
MQMLETRPHLGRHLFLDQYALHDSGAITNDDKGNFAMCARGLDPTANRDRITNVIAEMLDVAED